MGKTPLIGSKYICIRKNFGYWTSVLQQSIKYFNLEKGARQSDPISAYLFILPLEILFLFIKNDSSIKGIEFFDYAFLCKAYADDSTFFLKDLASVKNVLDRFSYYSNYSSFKPEFYKCEIAGIGSLKRVEKAVCGIKCVNLKVSTIKILRVHFSYNKKFLKKKNS